MSGFLSQVLCWRVNLGPYVIQLHINTPKLTAVIKHYTTSKAGAANIWKVYWRLLWCCSVPHNSVFDSVLSVVIPVYNTFRLIQPNIRNRYVEVSTVTTLIRIKTTTVRGQQVSHQRWIWGIHCMHAKKKAHKGIHTGFANLGQMSPEVQNRGIRGMHCHQRESSFSTIADIE